MKYLHPIFEGNIEDINFSFLPFSKGDTRVILVFAADISAENTSMPQYRWHTRV